MAEAIVVKEAPTLIKWYAYGLFPILLGIGITLLAVGALSKETFEKNSTAYKISGLVLLVLGVFSFMFIPVIGPLMFGVGVALTTFGFMSSETFEARRAVTLVVGSLITLIGVVGSYQGMVTIGKDTQRLYGKYGDKLRAKYE